MRESVIKTGFQCNSNNIYMLSSQLTWIANFIWGIADDVLRDIYVRGKYRDVILPMTVQ
jgi:type I restriction enzyme M protein